MARPREFDPALVLPKIMEVFWRHGFEGTSFSELERITGIRKASLCSAFGNKEEIFLAALARYQEERLAAFDSLCSERCSSIEVLRRWLQGSFSPSSSLCSSNPGHKPKGSESPRGCFAVNTIVELGPHSQRCRKLMTQHHLKVEKLLTNIIELGIERKEIRGSIHPATAAQFLLYVASGMHVQNGWQKAKPVANEVIDLALCALR